MVKNFECKMPTLTSNSRQDSNSRNDSLLMNQLSTNKYSSKQASSGNQELIKDMEAKSAINDLLESMNVIDSNSPEEAPGSNNVEKNVRTLTSIKETHSQVSNYEQATKFGGESKQQSSKFMSMEKEIVPLKKEGLEENLGDSRDMVIFDSLFLKKE